MYGTKCNREKINYRVTASNQDFVYNLVHNCYKIIGYLIIFGILSEILICKECKQNYKI